MQKPAQDRPGDKLFLCHILQELGDALGGVFGEDRAFGATARFIRIKCSVAICVEYTPER